MGELITVQEKNMQAVESALVRNDLSQLSTQERLTFYNKICESVGLNPLTKPFSFLKLNGKEVLYATKDATEQLRKIHGVSTQIVSKGLVGDLFEVHVKARDKNGKEDEDLSYVVVKGLMGSDLANAMLKGVTKAKRRVTLSICGLGILDESELDTLEGEFAPAHNPQITSPFNKIELSTAMEQNQQPQQITDNITALSDEIIQVGKYKGKSFHTVGKRELIKYIDWVKENVITSGSEWAKFVQQAEYWFQEQNGAPSTEEVIPF